FFFQAEDGIRDFHVTGVQTCALPISRTGQLRHSRTAAGQRRRASDDHQPGSSPAHAACCHQRLVSWMNIGPPYLVEPARTPWTKIGRASWRERVERGPCDQPGEGERK